MRVINENKLPTASIHELKATQGSLKFLTEENYNKLKSNIIKRGFYIPVYVWEDENKQKWLLDGHQRKHVLETEGWTDPIPYLKIPAKSMEEAAERLLEITSQFGTITQEGIDEFIATFELPELEVLDSTNFDGIFDFSVESFTSDEPEETVSEPKKDVPTFKLIVIDEEGELKAKITKDGDVDDLGVVELDNLQEIVTEELGLWKSV